MSRKASVLAKQCTTAVIVATMCFLAVTTNAASCDIPSFLKVGKAYQFEISSISKRTMTVLEIDKQSGAPPTCWIKVNYDGKASWLNLNQVVEIIEK